MIPWLGWVSETWFSEATGALATETMASENLMELFHRRITRCLRPLPVVDIISLDIEQGVRSATVNGGIPTRFLFGGYFFWRAG